MGVRVIPVVSCVMLVAVPEPFLRVVVAVTVTVSRTVKGSVMRTVVVATMCQSTLRCNQ